MPGQCPALLRPSCVLPAAAITPGHLLLQLLQPGQQLLRAGPVLGVEAHALPNQVHNLLRKEGQGERAAGGGDALLAPRRGAKRSVLMLPAWQPL